MTQHKRKIDPVKEEDDRLEEALEESFPASDPPSMTQPKPKPEKPAPQKRGGKALPEEDDEPSRVDRYEDEDK